MDEQMRVGLLGDLHYLRGQQEAIFELQAVAHSLRSTLRDLGTDAGKIYDKHYAAVMQSGIKTANDAVLAAIDLLIQQFSVPHDQSSYSLA